MKVLADFHHQSLFYSLQLLFEKRLGYELFRPIGMEWYEEGFWNVYPHPATAAQYLQVGSVPTDGSVPLNDLKEGKYVDYRDGVLQKGISLEEFKNTEFDILIASIPQHIAPFKKLIAEFQPQAKLIYQIGNQWNINPNEISNVLASALVDLRGINGVVYHQEFDVSTFHQGAPGLAKKIYSFVNCLNTSELYKQDWELFQKLEKLMPDWEFKSFGGQCRDGAIGPSDKLADKMREAAFIFHCKTGGDGYGHILHNVAAVGRPIVTRFSDYQGKLAEPLVSYPCTAVHVDDRTPEQIKDEIKDVFREKTVYKSYCEGIHDRFVANVDFDAEEVKIRKFLANLKA